MNKKTKQYSMLALLLAGVSFTPHTAKADYDAYKADVLTNSPTGFWDANQATAGGIPDVTANARNLTFGSDTSTWSIGTGTGPMAGAGTWANFTPYSIGDTRNTSLGVGAYNIQPGGLLSSFQLADGFTIEAWINSDQINIPLDFGGPDWGIIFGNRGYGFGIRAADPAEGAFHPGKLQFGAFGSASDIIGGTVVPSGWHMVNVTFDSSGTSSAVTFYIDGVKDTGTYYTSEPGPYTGFTAAAGDIFGLGHRLRLSTADTNAQLQPYKGGIGQVAFFSGVLSDQDIQDHYTAATSAPVPEPGSLALLGVGALSLVRRRRK